MLCPPPLMQSRSSCSRANCTHAITSAVPRQRTTSAGVLSIMAFQTVRDVVVAGVTGQEQRSLETHLETVERGLRQFGLATVHRFRFHDRVSFRLILEAIQLQN